MHNCARWPPLKSVLRYYASYLCTFCPPPHSSASTPADSTRLGPTADIMFLFLFFYQHSFVFLLFITINAWGESSSVEWSKRSQWRWAGTQAAQTDNVQPLGAFKVIDTTPEERLLKVWSPPFIRGAIIKDYLNSCGGLFLLSSLRLLRSNSIQPEDRSFAHPPPTITQTSVLCYVKTITAKKLQIQTLTGGAADLNSRPDK